VIVRRLIVVAVALTAALALLPPAIASLPRTHVHVTPAHGGPETTFMLSFVAPTTTGRSGERQVRDVLSAANHLFEIIEIFCLAQDDGG